MPAQGAKKLFYATSLFYPSQYANRLQMLQTAEALGKKLGDDFMLGCDVIKDAGSIYTHGHVDFKTNRSPVVAFKQLRYALKNGFGVVYSREYTILFMMYVYNFILFRRPVSFVLEVHDMYENFRFSFVVRRVKHIFCITNGLAEDIKSKFGISSTLITVLPDAVNPNDFEVQIDKSCLRHTFGLPEGAFVASYVGSVGVHPWKGVDVFLDSLSWIKNVKVHYVIAGVHKDELPVLREIYKKRPVTFLGWLSRSGVAEIMAASDVLILPNKSGFRIAERYTSPMKLFEYMASKRPIIASDLPSVREVLDATNAFLVPPNSPTLLAEMIDYVSGHSQEALVHARRALELVKNYSWEIRAQTILQTITGLSV